MKHLGIVVAERGAAIVTVTRTPAQGPPGGTDLLDGILVTGIERLPFDLAVVAKRVRELTDPDARYVIDSEGLGSALWAVLGHADDPHWTFYAGRGIERQALVDELLVAMEQDRFRFMGGIADLEPMSKALVGFRRQVKDDGVIGSELVVALLLAIIPPAPEQEEYVILGRPR